MGRRRGLGLRQPLRPRHVGGKLQDALAVNVFRQLMGSQISVSQPRLAGGNLALYMQPAGITQGAVPK